MKAPMPDLIPTAVQEAVEDHVEALFGEGQVTVEIEYRRVGTTSYSPTTGKQTRSGTGRWTLLAVHQVGEVKQTPKGRMREDEFLFEKSAMPRDPRKGDEIRLGSDVWTIGKWDADAQGLLWLVTARKANA